MYIALKKEEIDQCIPTVFQLATRGMFGVMTWGAKELNYITEEVFRGLKRAVCKFVYHHQLSKDKERTTNYAAKFDFFNVWFKKYMDAQMCYQYQCNFEKSFLNI